MYISDHIYILQMPSGDCVPLPSHSKSEMNAPTLVTCVRMAGVLIRHIPTAVTAMRDTGLENLELNV